MSGRGSRSSTRPRTASSRSLPTRTSSRPTSCTGSAARRSRSRASSTASAGSSLGPSSGRPRPISSGPSNRRDFPVPPPGDTLLDRLSAAGHAVFGVGKIEDIFTGRGIGGAVHTASDSHGIDETLLAMERVPDGLVFTNLVDFDTLYGHRNDVAGYAANLERVDARLGEVLDRLGPADLFVLTADHGCDPSDQSTDHTREHVPLLLAGGGGRGRGGPRSAPDLRGPGRDAGRELRRGSPGRGNVLPDGPAGLGAEPPSA